MKPYHAKPVEYPSLLGAALRVGADVTGSVGRMYRLHLPPHEAMERGERR
jgi:hypothetical protein